MQDGAFPIAAKKQPARNTRLLITVRGGENYGVATKLLNFASVFRSRGWSVAVYALGDGEFVEAARKIEGVEVTVDPAIPARYDPARYGRIGGYFRVVQSSAGFVGRLRRFLRTGGYDAMIFCEHGLVLPMAAAVAGRQRAFWLMPNIVSGGYPADLNRRAYALAFRLSGMIPVANSIFTKATLGRAGGRAEKIDLGVRGDPFLAPPGPDPLIGRVPQGAPRLLVMGRLTPFKGQRELLKGLLATPGLETVHLVVCGGPSGSPFEAELRADAAAAGASDRLHLIGAVDDTAAYYHACDAVASVRVDPEPFGLSVVEAMLAAKPVLAHALGGPADIVVDGETGWLIDAMTPEAVAGGLSRMMAVRADWRKMGEAGRARALRHFTVDTMADQLEAVFARHGVAVR